jgi:hypothetical protein
MASETTTGSNIDIIREYTEESSTSTVPTWLRST